jgi:hypothetical protein
MFRFTLRDVFWAILVVAMGLGWWLHVQKMNQEMARVQSDLLYQADFVDSLVKVVQGLGCEIPPDTDPRCAAGGPYTRVFYPGPLAREFNIVSTTITGPRSELQRAIDQEFGVLYRDKPAILAVRAGKGW